MKRKDGDFPIFPYIRRPVHESGRLGLIPTYSRLGNIPASLGQFFNFNRSPVSSDIENLIVDIGKVLMKKPSSMLEAAKSINDQQIQKSLNAVLEIRNPSDQQEELENILKARLVELQGGVYDKNRGVKWPQRVKIPVTDQTKRADQYWNRTLAKALSINEQSEN